MIPAQSLVLNALLRAVHFSGLRKVVGRSRWRSDRILILAYHGFSKRDEHLWSDLYVEPSWFCRRIEFLRKEGYVPLSLDQLVDYLRGAEIPERSVVVTIDDGFHDFLKFAFPILSSSAIPATLYVTTYYVCHHLPVFDPALSYLMWKGGGKRFSLPWEKQGLFAPARGDHVARSRLHAGLRATWQALGISTEEKHATLLNVGKAFGVDMDEFLAERMFGLLSPEEVENCAVGGIDVQLHTHRHRVPFDDQLFANEISDNRRRLQGIMRTQRPLKHFCYPPGEYHESSPSVLRTLEVETATTCEFGYVTRSSNPLLLPRLLDSMTISEARFSAWLAGLMGVRYRRG